MLCVAVIIFLFFASEQINLPSVYTFRVYCIKFRKHVLVMHVVDEVKQKKYIFREKLVLIKICIRYLGMRIK